MISHSKQLLILGLGLGMMAMAAYLAHSNIRPPEQTMQHNSHSNYLSSHHFLYN